MQQQANRRCFTNTSSGHTQAQGETGRENESMRPPLSMSTLNKNFTNHRLPELAEHKFPRLGRKALGLSAVFVAETGRFPVGRA